MAQSGEYPFLWRGRIPPDALSLDDFEVGAQLTGAPIRPHVGETVWCRPYGVSMKDGITRIAHAFARFMASVHNADEAEIDAAGIDLAGVICERVLGWDITDPETGEPYPQPTEGPEVVYATLPARLFVFLATKLVGVEATTDRGEDSGASAPTSSTSEGERRRKSR